MEEENPLSSTVNAEEEIIATTETLEDDVPVIQTSVEANMSNNELSSESVEITENETTESESKDNLTVVNELSEKPASTHIVVEEDKMREEEEEEVIRRQQEETALQRKREREFVSKVKEATGGDTVKYNHFKIASGEFRRGEIDGERYYSAFVSVVGPAQASYLIPLLLGILPDISMSKALKDAAINYEIKTKQENIAREKATEEERQRIQKEKRLKAEQEEAAKAKTESLSDDIFGRMDLNQNSRSNVSKPAQRIPSTTSSSRDTNSNANDWFSNSANATTNALAAARKATVTVAIPDASPVERASLDNFLNDSSSVSSTGLYSGSGPNQIDDIIVKPRQTRFLSLQCKANDVLAWKFHTIPASVVDFSAVFTTGAADVPVLGGLQDAQAVEVYPFTRLRDCQGVFVAPGNGILRLDWDNHFSVVKPKNITCQTRLLKGSDATKAAREYKIKLEKKKEDDETSAQTVAEKAKIGKSFNARIDGYEEREDISMKVYTVFMVTCHWVGKLDEQDYKWNIPIRYSQFRDLHQSLIEKYPFEAGELPLFPSKAYTIRGTVKAEILNIRQRDLNNWLVAVISNPKLLHSKEVENIVCLKSHLRKGKAIAIERVRERELSKYEDNESDTDRKKSLSSSGDLVKQEEAAKNCKDPLSYLMGL